MFTLFLWALLLGGMPASGYYLYQYGRKIYARSYQQRQTYTEPEEVKAQWQRELVFSAWTCVWAGVGLFICQVLKQVENL